MLVAIHLPEPQPFVFFLPTVWLFAFSVLRVLCFSFSEGALLNFSDMFWIAALYSFLIVIYSKVIISSTVFHALESLFEKIHKLKLCLMKYFFEKIMNFELLYCSKK